MNIEQFRDYCLSKKGVTENFPFDEVTLVFKVLNKMFALTSITSPIFKVNLKCDPEKAIQLREEFENSIQPGFHMSKKHWNTVEPNLDFDDSFFIDLVNHSYDLIVKGMTKKDRALLNNIAV